jgi:hypothetical protein
MLKFTSLPFDSVVKIAPEIGFAELVPTVTNNTDTNAAAHTAATNLPFTMSHPSRKVSRTARESRDHSYRGG